MGLGDESDESAWLPCQVIRYLGEKQCVVRIIETGAIIPVVLTHSLGSKRAPLLHPLRSVEGKIKMGPFDREGFVDCELQAKWESHQRECFPPPQNYRKRKSSDT